MAAWYATGTARLLLGSFMVVASLGADEPEKGRAGGVNVDQVARLPHPGTVAPASVAFTPDGSAVTFLLPEARDSLSRVAWRAEVPDGAPRVVARPPGAGVTEAGVSREEELRRERQRLRATGIAQVVRAEKADVSVYPLDGNLYLQRGTGELEQITDTADPEIDPQLTSDGSKVAFVRAGELYALDLESRQETRLTHAAGEGLTHGLAEFIAQEELDRSSGFWWSPDGARIAYQETDERHIPLYTIAHQGESEPTSETHRYPFAGADNARVRLGVVPADGGETRWLPFAEPNEEVYLARVDWDGPGRLLVQVLDRDQRRLRLLRIDVETGRRTTLLTESADTWVNLHNDLRIVEGTGELLWSSERTGFRHLELRTPDGALVCTLTAGDWAVDSVVGLDQERREVWFLAGKDDPRETHLFRVGLDGGPIERLTHEPGTHAATVSPDGELFTDTHSNLQQPPLTTLRDRSGRVLSTLDDAADDPRLATLKLEEPRLVSFENRDGVTLHGAYYAPSDGTRASGQKAPLIVMVYGGPHVQTVTNSWALAADLMAQILAERGFAVWKCDNRGAARRGHAFEAPLHRQMGTVEVRDQVDGVRYVAEHFPEVDAARVGITGGSYGGYMTLRCLALAPEVFRAGVAVAPVTDWDGYDTAYTERYMSTPADNPQGYRDSSVLPLAGAITGELLVIHGMLDENVHFRHSGRLAAALIDAETPFELLPLPSSRHSSRRFEDRRHVIARTLDFFAETLDVED